MRENAPAPIDHSRTRGLLVPLLALALVVGACQSPAAAPAATAVKGAVATAVSVAPTVAATVAATVASMATAVPPIGTGGPSAPVSTAMSAANAAAPLAEQGANVYTRACASCHGARGEGVTAPALIGSGANLGGRFATAKELDAYTRSNMPMDKPGSLTEAEYTHVVAFMLLRNDLVKATDVITPQTLETIRLRR